MDFFTKKKKEISSKKSSITKRSFYLPLIAIFIILVTIILVCVIVTMDTAQDLESPGYERIECPGLSVGDCIKYCTYSKVKVGPSCYMEKNKFGYSITRVIHENDTMLSLELKTLSSQTPYGESIAKVSFTLMYLTENILRFQLKDVDNDRYEVPVQADFPLLQNPPDVNANNLSYEIIRSNKSETFRFAVTRKEDNTILWDTSVGALLLSDKYLQIGSYLPSEYIYGLGEHAHDSIKHSMNYRSWPMFSRGRPPESTNDRGNLYSVHPFYTCLENSGKSHGVFFLNSNAMEVTFMPAPAVTFRTIGGILDFFIFVGDNPEHVVQLYTSLIGRPMIPPYWSLGFQLSRYGYHQLSDLTNAINRTITANIPLAVQFLDIDHMYGNRDFTYDNTTFEDLPSYMEKMKNEYGLKWIIILDAGIPAEKDFMPFSSGLEKSVFIKRSPKWKPSMFPKHVQKINVTIGKSWPEAVAAFPDFFLNETKQWWKDNIIKHHETIKFDGLWIDMNEPTSFGTNEDYPFYCEEMESGDCWSLKCPSSPYEEPPYNPLLTGGSNRMSMNTLCMDSVQGKDGEKSYLHYDVHSLYGWSQIMPTLEAAQSATGTRSLVISRSTYPSSGRYAGHWLGDNESTYTDLKKSIIGMLEFNLFGIPYVGADICGFHGQTTTDLCKRWLQLGAFYPFYRSHNSKEQKEKDPASFGPDVATASRRAVERRISLNPYLYTLFYRAHVDGSTVVRPVFHEFPNDEKTWEMNVQFLWGKSIMVVPIVDEKRKSVTLYLPKDEWWRFHEKQSKTARFTERYVLESNADPNTPIYIRGGLILPYAIFEPGTNPENVTTSEFMLYVFPKNDEAAGELFVDDGTSVDTVKNEAYALYEFTYSNCTLKLTKQEYSNFSGATPVLQTVVIFKVQEIESVSNNYNFTLDAGQNVAVITINSDMKNVEEITWEDADKNCKMLP